MLALARARSPSERPLDPNIKRRNNYARAKAAVEDLLIEMHRKEGLPRRHPSSGHRHRPRRQSIPLGRRQVVVGRRGRDLGRRNEQAAAGAGRRRRRRTGPGHGERRASKDGPTIWSTSRCFRRATISPALERLGGFKIDAHPRIDLTLLSWRTSSSGRSSSRSAIPTASACPAIPTGSRARKKPISTRSRTREELGWKPISDARRMISEGIGGSLAAWLAARRSIRMAAHPSTSSRGTSPTC